MRFLYDPVKQGKRGCIYYANRVVRPGGAAATGAPQRGRERK